MELVALLADQTSIVQDPRASLLIAAGVAVIAAATSLLLPRLLEDEPM